MANYFEYKVVILTKSEMAEIDLQLNHLAKHRWRVHSILPLPRESNSTRLLLERERLKQD